MHTEIRSGISQQTFCWTYSLQNLVTDSKRTHRQARALVCLFFLITKRNGFQKRRNEQWKGLGNRLRVSHIQSTDHFVYIHVHSANNLDPVQSIFSQQAIKQFPEKYGEDAVKVQSKYEKSVRKVQSKCGQCAGKARKVRRKCENSVDNTYFKEKIFDLQFLDYFTATSWL